MQRMLSRMDWGSSIWHELSRPLGMHGLSPTRLDRLITCPSLMAHVWELRCPNGLRSV